MRDDGARRPSAHSQTPSASSSSPPAASGSSARASASGSPSSCKGERGDADASNVNVKVKLQCHYCSSSFQHQKYLKKHELIYHVGASGRPRALEARCTPLISHYSLVSLLIHPTLLAHNYWVYVCRAYRRSK